MRDALVAWLFLIVYVLAGAFCVALAAVKDAWHSLTER